MNRRGFLGAILAAGIAPAIVRSKSLMRCSGIIVPQTEILFAQGNTILTASIIARESLQILKNNLHLASNVDEYYGTEYKHSASPKITVRHPATWVSR